MFSKERKGFSGQVTKNFIGLMVIVIIAVSVVIPVVQTDLFLNSIKRRLGIKCNGISRTYWNNSNNSKLDTTLDRCCIDPYHSRILLDKTIRAYG